MSVKSKLKEGAEAINFRLGSTSYRLEFDKKVTIVTVDCLLLTNVGKELLQLLPMEPLKRTANRIKELCRQNPTKVIFREVLSDGKVVTGEA